jgi:hypothetical protein
MPLREFSEKWPSILGRKKKPSRESQKLEFSRELRVAEKRTRASRTSARTENSPMISIHRPFVQSFVEG